MANEYKTNIEHMLLGYYIKYDKLQELTSQTLVNSRFAECDDVDIYIDVYDMFKQLYTSNVYTTKNFILVSSVINLVAHLREFYWSRYHVNSRIFVVYGDCSCINHKQFYLNFGDQDFSQMRNFDITNRSIQSQLEMIKILCGYIYRCYYVRRTTDFSMFTYDNILKNPNIPSIIITKSKYSYQIPAMCENAFIYRPKKFKQQDLSIAITHGNVLFAYNNKINREKTIEQLKFINPKLLSLIMALTGLSSKKLLTLLNTTTAVGRVYKAITENKIINDYNTDIDYVYNALELFSSIDQVNFKYRFNAVDLVYQWRLYSNMAEYNDVSWFIDLKDRRGMHEIANKYFIDNPLDLNSL